MNLKQLINKSIYGTIGYVSSQDDIDLLESYILYNLPVLREFKQIVIATNYSSSLQAKNEQIWRKYFPNCIILDSPINRGHSFGTADLDNLVFNWCKKNNEKWLCKGANDIIISELILEKQIEKADFYYLNGISYEDLYLNGFNYEKIYNQHFFPQTNFYLIRIDKIDYIYNNEYIDKMYQYILSIPDYTNKIWEYFPEWSCELSLKGCVERNKLKKYYLLNKNKHNILCEIINVHKIGDPSHKNIMINGICHFHYPHHQILEI
jgi:hypothetical protein